MKKEQIFDNMGVMCVCLDKRKEHWTELSEQCKQHNLNMIPWVCGDGSDKSLTYDQIDAINPPTAQWGYGVPHLKHHHYNCLTAHKGIIQKAKDNKWDSVLMLEDDTYFLKRFDDVMDRVDVPDDWQLIYLSWWYGDEHNLWNNEVEDEYRYKGKTQVLPVTFNIGGWHSVIVRSSLYDTILSLPYANPLDTQFCYLRPQVPSYMILPKVTHIKSIFSFTEGCVFNRKKLT